MRAAYTRRMRSVRWAVIGVLALALVPALAALHSRSFFSPDETNYTEVAREMIETGDLVVPHLDGHVWFNKPPLAYWLLAGSFVLLGWGFPAAVLLNSLLTGLTAVLVLVHVRRRATPRAGVLAALVYLTMAMPIMAARTALTDPTLVLCTTGAIVLFLIEGRAAVVAAGALLGLGILAKGPVAPLVVGPALLVAAWQGARRGGWRRLGIAAAAAAAVVAPWQAALLARGMWTAWAREFLGYEVLARATETWRIRAPWWYYLPVAWAATFPWGTHAALLIGAGVRGVRNEPTRGRADLPELAAVVVPLLAFSAATSKLPHYLLPTLPFVAAWLGRAADRLWEQDRVPAPRWVTAVIALSGGGGLAALAWLAVHSPATRFLPSAAAPLLVVAALAFVAVALVEGAGRRRAAWAGMAALALVLRLGLDLGLAPYLDRQVPERAIAKAVRASLADGGLPIAHRWWRTSFVTYGVRGWLQTETEEQLGLALKAAWNRSQEAVVVVRSDSEGEVRSAAWNAGGEVREKARIVGLGEISGEVIEAIVFAAEPRRSGERFFYGADAPLSGEMGFAGVETNQWVAEFRWTTVTAASLPVDVTLHVDATLRVRAWALAAGGVPQRVDVRIGDQSVGALTLGSHPSVQVLAVPSDFLPSGKSRITLQVSRLAVPSQIDPTSKDTRSLGLALDWIALDPASPTVRLVK
jgi:4-amino-4-deoxy-L-arabinose transferase-like glycosyltransferase